MEIVNYKDYEIRKFLVVDSALYYAIDIGKILGIVRISSSIKNFTNTEILGVEEKKRYGIITTKIHRGNLVRDDKISLLTDNGVKKLICNSRSIHADDLATFLGIDIHTRITPVEISTITQILRVFKKEKYQLQYTVNNYRIDLYFPIRKIAIECDEHNHDGRDPEYEINRENTIKEALNCEFIRYNPNAPNFDILDIIHEIYEKLKT
jgi:very-short-patch-repair endonuclease